MASTSLKHSTALGRKATAVALAFLIALMGMPFEAFKALADQGDAAVPESTEGPRTEPSQDPAGPSSTDPVDEGLPAEPVVDEAQDGNAGDPNGDEEPVPPRDLTDDEDALAIELAGLAYDDAEGNEALIEADAEGNVDASSVDPKLLASSELRFKATVQPGAAQAGDSFALAVPQEWCALPASEQLAAANEQLGGQATLALVDGKLQATLTEAAAEAAEPFELAMSYPLALADGVLKDEPATVELPLQGDAVANITLPAKPQVEKPASEGNAILGATATTFQIPAPTDFTDKTDQLLLGLVTFSYLDTAGKKHEVPVTDDPDGNNKKHLDFSDVPFASIDKMSMEVDFKILLDNASRAMKTGDYYAYELPSIFTIPDNTSPQNIVAPTGDVLGSFTIENGEIRVVFAEAVDIEQGNVGIVGGVECEFSFNGEELSNTDPTKNEWQLQAGGTTYVFSAPKKSTDLVGIEKKGVFNKGDSTVTWTIGVGTDPKSAGAPLKGITITDEYDKTKQESPAVVRDAQGNELTVIETDAGFTYTFPEDSKAVAPYELTVTTSVADDVLKAAANGEQTLENTAAMSAPEGSPVVVPPDSRTTGSTVVPPFGLDKQGTPLNSSTIAWDIVVNKDAAGSAQNVVVYDRLDPRAAFIEGTLMVGKVKVPVNPNPAPTDQTYALIAPDLDNPGSTLMEVHFAGTVSDEQHITFDTTINASAQPDETIKFPNTAWMTYDWPRGEGPGPGVTRNPLSIGTDFQVVYLDKETPNYDPRTGVIDWTIKPSTRTGNYTKGIITDTVNDDQALVENSVHVLHHNAPLPGEALAKVYQYDPATKTMAFTFDKNEYDLNDIEITYQTQALNFQRENMMDHPYENKAYLDVYQGGDLKFKADDTAQRAFKNEFLAKTSDYSVVDDATGSTGHMHYKIVVNGSYMPSKNLKLTDDLTSMVTKVIGPDKADLGTIDAGEWAIAKDPAHAIKVTKSEKGRPSEDVTSNFDTATWASSKKIEATFSDGTPTSACYTVDIWLTLDKDELQRLQKDHNGAFTIQPANTATASSTDFNSGTPVNVTCTGSADAGDIDNRLVAKSADGARQSEGILEYRININPNGSILDNAVITDTPDPTLDIDLSSVRLYYANHGEGGAISEEVGGEVDASAWSKELAFDKGAGRTVLKVTLPNGSASYVLKYQAKIVSAPAGGTVKNEVTISADNDQKGTDSCEASVDSDSWGWLTKKAIYKFVKADEFGEKATPIPGIVFNLYSDASCDEGALVTTAVSNAKGIVAFYGLDEDKDYYYKECAAANGYELLTFDPSVHKFTTGKAGSSTIAPDAVKNQRTTSNVPVKITKKFDGSPGSGNMLEAEFTLYLYPNGFNGGKRVAVPVAQIEEGVFRYALDGTSKLANKGGDGSLEIQGLPWGDYGLEESLTWPDKGYARYKGVKCFSVVAPSQEGGIWEVKYAPGTASDIGTRQTIWNLFTKVNIEKSTQAPHSLEGTELGIYKDSNGVKGTRVRTYTAQSGLEFTWNISALEPGTYWLSEDVPPTDAGVGKFEDVQFNLDEYGTLTLPQGGAELATGNTIKVVDNVNKVTVKKLDQWGAGVAGATLQLQKWNTGTTQWEDAGFSWTSTSLDAQTGHTFSGLHRATKYRVIEMAPLPSGYAEANHVPSGQMIEFTISEYGKVTNVNLHNDGVPKSTNNGAFLNSHDASTDTFTMCNERIVGHAEFVKYDTTQVDGANKTLKGVGFDLYLKDPTGDKLVNTDHFVSDANGKVTTQGSTLKFAADLGTAKKGEPISRGLPGGTYYFKEVATYDDFVFDKDNPLVTDTFTVDGAGQHFTWKNDGSFGDVATVTMPDGSLVTNAPLKAEVHLLKMDKDSYSPVIGATFELREKITGNVVDRQTTRWPNPNYEFKNTIKETDSNGNVHTAKDAHDGSLVFVNVPAGTYVVVETVPAPGYQLDSARTIADVTVAQDKAGETYYAYMTDPGDPWITNEPNKFSVEKAGQDGQGVVGTKFELSGVNGATFAKAGTGPISWEVEASSNNPYEIVGELAAGSVYKLTEMVPAPGYQLAADVYLKMTATGELQQSASATGPWTKVENNKLTVTNELNELSIAKKDQFDRPVSGATLQLLETVGGMTSPIIEWSTSTDNPKDITGKLVADKEYTLHESATPDGYLTAADQVIRMTAAGQLQAEKASGGWEDVSDNALTFENTLSLAHAKIVKTDDAGDPFTGATFDLFKKGGTSPLIRGITLSMDSDGKASWSTKSASGMNPDTGKPFSKGLANGEYYFVETATDNDHRLDETHHEFKLDNGTHGTTVEKTAMNAKMNASMSLHKVDATDTTTSIAGATFELAYTPAGSTSSTTITPTTGPDGTIKAENLGKGSYTLKETGTDANYVNGGFEATFEVTDDCQGVSLVIGADAVSKAPYNLQVAADEEHLLAGSLANERVLGTVNVEKQDAEGNELAGVTFEVRKASDDATVGDPVVTDALGKATFSNLPWGEYYLVETAVPAGYVLDDTHHGFAIGYGALTKSFAFAENSGIVNTQNAFTLEKYAEGGSTGLKGAKFTIEGAFADGKTDARPLLEAGAEAVTWTGKLVGGNSYTLRETVPPAGYQTVPDFEVTMGANGKLALVGTPKGVELEDNTIKVSDPRNTAPIAKVDVESKNLAGASFELKALNGGTFADGSTEFTWTSDMDDEVLTGLLVAGTEYQLTETAPAPGYTLPTTLPATLRMTNDGQLERLDGSDWVAVLNNRFVVKDVQNVLALAKQDADGAALVGAVFTVTGDIVNADGTVTSQTIPLLNADGDRSQSSGTVTGRLVAGKTYTVHEVVPPDGYVKTDDFTVVMNADGTIAAAGALPTGVTVDGANAAIVVKDVQNKIQIAKTDADGGYLAGAEFKLAGTFADGSSKLTWTSLAGAPAEGKGLFTGKLIANKEYELSETTPPEGYKRTTDLPCTLRVTPEGEMQRKDGAETWTKVEGGVLSIKNDQIEASLAKVDEGGGLLAGATLELAGKFANTTETELTWTSSDAEAWNLDGKLIAGETYTLTEPRLAGHLTLPGAVTFAVGDDGTLSITRNQQLDGKNGMVDALSLAPDGLRLNLLNVAIVADVELTKTLDGKGPLQGVTFDLCKEGADSPLKSGLVTDADGKIKVEGLPEGSYYFVETATVDGAVVDTAPRTFTVGEDQHHKVVAVGMDNTSFKTSVSLAKVDGTSGEALAGAQFALFKRDADGAFQPVDGPVATNEHGAVAFTMGERGTYRVQETAAPVGYVLDPSAPYTAEFTVENTDAFQNETLELVESMDAATVEKYNLTVENAQYKGGFVANERKLGSVKLVKEDASTGGPLNGVEFKLYAAGDPATLLGTFATGKAYPAPNDSTGATADDGALSIAGLAWGDYYLQEARADGYQLDPTPHKFSIGAANADAVPSADLGVIENNPIVFSFDKLELYAESCSDPVLGAEDPAATRALEGAEFTLFVDDACTQPAKLADGSPATATSDADGLVRFERVVAGSYSVKETVVPDGRDDGGAVYALDVTTDGTVTRFAPKDQAEGVLEQVVNDVHRADIRIKKVAETDESKVLPNSVYGLFKRVASEPAVPTRARMLMAPAAAAPDIDQAGGLQLIAKATTGPDGYLTFKGILMDTEYVIQELVAPDGSLVSKNPIKLTFEMGKDGMPRIVAFEDGSGTAKVDENGNIVWREPQVMVGFAKTDPSGKLLAGAKLQVVDESGAVMGEPWTSSADAEHVIEGLLTAGKTYRLVETQAPAGYRKAADVEFTVDDPVLEPDQNHVQHVTMVDQPLPATPANGGPAGRLTRTGDPAAQMALLAGGIALAGGALAGAAALRRRRSR